MKKRPKQKRVDGSTVVQVIEEPAIPGLEEKIWRRNRVHELSEGIALKRNGRAGHLYHRQGERFIDIAVELAGDPTLDIVVYVPEILHWVHVRTFERTALSADERQAEVDKFRAYLDAQGLRYSI